MTYDGKLLARARQAMEREKEQNEALRQRRLDEVYRRIPEIEQIDADFDVYDLVVIGTPVWADKVSAPINSLLENRSLHGFGIALLVTSASGETDKCADDLAKKAGLRVKPRTLSLKNPLKMDADELAAQIDAFAAELKRMKNSRNENP